MRGFHIARLEGFRPVWRGEAVEFVSDFLLAPGMLVALPNRRGVASIVTAEGERCRVSLFHSIESSEIEDYPMAALSRAFLGRETRVYVSSASGQWHVGRIKDYDAAAAPYIDYVVKFPNGRVADLSERNIRVRVFEPHADPAEVLAAGGGESQFFHDRRWAALTATVSLRSAAQGLTGALSSRIELAPHQLYAARRVVTDPVPRFLLADEVGMGKTMEAGIVARQWLIDDPCLQVEVIAPGPLVAQWRRELFLRCGLDDFGAQVTIRPFGELADITAPPDLLIVDEAHNLLAEPGRRQTLTRLAHAAPRLLLLSATPALGAPADLLALLHLLDPAAYSAADMPKLEARLALGRDLGRILLTLTDDAPTFLLKRSLAELAGRVPDDATVGEIAARYAADQGDPGSLADLRQHLADTYRVHQRLIRARRRDAGLYFQTRGVVLDGRREHLHEEVDEDWRWPEILAGLEDLRDRRQADDGGGAAACFLAHVESISARMTIDTDADAPASLRSALDGETGPRTRVEVAADVLVGQLRRLEHQGQATPKLVTFATDSACLPRLEKALLELGRQAAVLTHDLGPAEAEARAQRFRDDPGCAVLLCDRAGEEGLNLSFADGILHLDLPFSVTRMEQRIGRLDRFGRRKRSVRQRVLLPSDDDLSPWAAWHEVLRDGFEIFEASTSDVQFVLPDLEADLAAALLERGADGLRAKIPEIRERLAAARRAADEQYALDAVALADDSVDLVEAIEESEADEPGLQSAIEQWLVGTLQFERGRVEQDQVIYRWARETLVPKHPWGDELAANLDCPVTWRRRVALHRGVALMRPGAPLIDAMERHLRWDDRGSAFATWRVDPAVSGDDIAWIGFRLCFVLEPSLDHDLAIFRQSDREGLKRRAQRFLQSSTAELHLDGEGSPAPASLLPILCKPYSKEPRPEGGRDFNLCSRSRLFQSVISPGAFANLAREMRNRAQAAVLADPYVQVRISVAEKAARADARRFLRRGGGVASGAVEAIVDAVRTPRVRLDSMGFFVLSRTPPESSLL